MNKGELVEAIVKETHLTKADSEKALQATLEAITNALKEGDKVQITGFGTFSVRERKARKGRNPATGEEIEIGATVTPV
ncbi:MAG TPA: HU family DNA-binding protein, partial [bacterium]|nr:HU family DNA-binding protein [bacterium]